MRILALLFLSFSLNAHAIEEDTKTETDNAKTTQEQKNKKQIKLGGHLNEEDLIKQFEAISDKGIDLSQRYKWEFRFTAKVMSSLENFAQYAHSLGFWPVALESDITGDTYWLYIQKTSQYTQEEFVFETTQLFKMADYAKLDTFDGFSIDKPDTAESKQ